MNKFSFFAAAALLLFACTPGEIVTPGGNTPGGDTPEDKPATIQVTGITLDKTEVSIKEGESVTLIPTVKQDNASNKSVTWTSSNEAIATVDNSGKVTGVKAGTAVIIVITQDVGKTASCTVTVKAEEKPEEDDTTVHVTGITLDKATATITEGESVTLVPTVKPDNATNKAVNWTSSSEAVATVDNSGKVTGVKAGTATITATTQDGSKTAICKVTVKAKSTVAVTGITLDKVIVDILEGKTLTLVATLNPSDAANKAVSWTSSNKSVATVDSNGKVTGVKSGTATITVTTKDGGKTATCTVTVKSSFPSLKEGGVEDVTYEKWEL